VRSEERHFQGRGRSGGIGAPKTARKTGPTSLRIFLPARHPKNACCWKEFFPIASSGHQNAGVPHEYPPRTSFTRDFAGAPPRRLELHRFRFRGKMNKQIFSTPVISATALFRRSNRIWALQAGLPQGRAFWKPRGGARRRCLRRFSPHDPAITNINPGGGQSWKRCAKILREACVLLKEAGYGSARNRKLSLIPVAKTQFAARTVFWGEEPKL